MASGQGAAVYGFNRVARGIEAIMAKVGIVCCDYVDDYPIVEPELTVDSAIVAFVSFAQLLSWKVKNPQQIVASANPLALGVIFKLGAIHIDGEFEVVNKESRVEEDIAAIEKVLSEGRLPGPVARRLRGRLQFAATQLYGSCGAMAQRTLAEFADKAGGARQLHERARMALPWWVAHLRLSPPRKVKICGSDSHVTIFRRCLREGGRLRGGGPLRPG